jgi:hypothetical protein
MAGEEPDAGEHGRPTKEVAKMKALVSQRLAYIQALRLCLLLYFSPAVDSFIIYFHCLSITY